MGDLSSGNVETVDGSPVPPAEELEKEKARLDALRKTAWWYIMKGPELTETSEKR